MIIMMMVTEINETGLLLLFPFRFFNYQHRDHVIGASGQNLTY
jgi:hypothetical protein